jgi:hypothetical protein
MAKKRVNELEDRSAKIEQNFQAFKNCETIQTGIKCVSVGRPDGEERTEQKKYLK